MGWAKEKYTKEYFLKKDESGRALPYGADGVEAWEKGEIYEPSRVLLDQIHLKGAVVLDIGCGRGEAVRYCLKSGAGQVIGLDFSEAALELAEVSVRGFDTSRYELVCEDVITYIQRTGRAYTHILMLDVIEHIPRSEVEDILPRLYACMQPGGSLIVHTPFYPEDDDVLETGGKEVCRDTSDNFEETKGMHINRYSLAGLADQMGRCGFVCWIPHIYLRPTNKFPINALHGKARATVARWLGYKIK